MSPILSLLRIAAKARMEATSAETSFLNLPAEPNSPEELTSTISMTVSSRSSLNSLIKGCPMRAVTFQSMSLMSSPGAYSRTALNSIPRPLNAETYSPAIRSVTIWPVLIWMERIFCISSGEISFSGTGGDGVLNPSIIFENMFIVIYQEA